MTPKTSENLQEKFKISLEITPRHPSDCERIVRVASSIGLYMTMGQAQTVWDWYSENNYCAGWISIRDDQEIIEAIHLFIDRRDLSL